MNYLIIGVASFAAGVVLTRLYFNSVIAAGKNALNSIEARAKSIL